MNVVGRRRYQGRASLRGLVAAVVCGVALCVPGTAVATPPCSTHQLQLSFVRETRNAGHVFWDFALRNSGHSECLLHGYPSVQLLRLDGHPLPQPEARVGQRTGLPVAEVVVKPQKQAFVTLLFRDGAQCPQQRFSFYRTEFFHSHLVYPPVENRHPPARSVCNNSALVYPIRALLNVA